MRSQQKSETREPQKAMTLPTDLEQLLWSASLYLAFAVMAVAFFKSF